MADGIAALGIATTSRNEVLTVYRVIVRVADSGDVEVEPLAAWRSTAQDEARSMNDLVDALSNTLDRRRRGAPRMIAVKRTESTQGRPTKAYDQKTRAEAAAMIAASAQGRRYIHYRTTQMKGGDDLHRSATSHGGYPSVKEEQEAVAAACAALAELLQDAETDD